MPRECKFCIVCQRWVDINDSRRRYTEHPHAGSEASYLFPCEWPIPIGSHALAGETVKKTLSGRWRAGWVIYHTGYADHDVWGHPAGGWSHWHYRAMKAGRQFISFATRQGALDFIVRKDLEDIVGVEPEVECGAAGY